MPIVPSCENATCALPEWHRELFRGHEETLTSPEGWSPGALNLAQAFSTKFAAPLAHGDSSRLLIDLSHHPGDPARFSRFTSGLGEEAKQKITERHHLSHIHLLRQRVAELLRRGQPVFHLSFDTADDSLPGTVNLRHHPDREAGRAFASVWRDALRERSQDLDVRTDAREGPGLSDLLHAEFPEPFASLRVVVRRSAFLDGRPVRWETLKRILLDSIPRHFL